MASAEELKGLGNKAFSAGDHTTAIKYFSDAIALDPNNHVLYSNRSASYTSLKNYPKALEDAEKCISIKPDWSKGYGRKGAALFGLNKLREAESAYKKGLEIDPSNEQLKKGLADIREAGGQGLNMMANILQDPNLLAKLAANPKTRDYMTQPDFIEKIKTIQANPQTFELLASDPRILQSVLALIGFDPQAEDPMEAATRPPEPQQEEPKREEPKREEPKREEPKKEQPKKEQPKNEPSDEMNVDESIPKVSEEQKRKANEEKELGTQLYKKRDFEGALKHYRKAWELDPTNIVFLNNTAAVHFESGDFDACIEVSQKAVEVGRDLRADYQHIAKAFARIASAYHKKEDYENAVLYFEKSLSEHRNPEVLTKLREAEKLRDQKAKEAYINPDLSDEAREKGNQLFKEQNYGEAIKFYNEAVKRNPKDARNYSNRAAAYTKLMALPESLKDCEEALKLDPKFLKCYIRKAHTLAAMKKFSEALTTIEQARELDTDGTHATELRELEFKCFGGNRNLSEAEIAENARRDPEVAQILSDPVMNSILEQMKTDPRAAGEHLKNPAVAKKIQKLIDAGIIRMGR